MSAGSVNSGTSGIVWSFSSRLCLWTETINVVLSAFLPSAERNESEMIMGLLDKMLAYIEEKEEIIDGEWNRGRTFKQILADGDAPDLYHEIKVFSSDLAAAESAAYKRGLLRGAEMTYSRCDCNCCCHNADAIKEEAEKL